MRAEEIEKLLDVVRRRPEREKEYESEKRMRETELRAAQTEEARVRARRRLALLMACEIEDVLRTDAVRSAIREMDSDERRIAEELGGEKRTPPEAVAKELHISRAGYYRKRDGALAKIAAAV